MWLHSLVGRASHRYFAKITGLNSVEALIFFRLLLSTCLNRKIYYDDHSSVSFTLPVSTVRWPAVNADVTTLMEYLRQAPWNALWRSLWLNFREDLTIEDGIILSKVWSRWKRYEDLKVWSHRCTVHAKTRHPENHPPGPPWGGKMPSQSSFRCVLARNHKWHYPLCQPVWSLPETPEENVKGTTATTGATM